MFGTPTVLPENAVLAQERSWRDDMYQNENRMRNVFCGDDGLCRRFG